MRLMFFLLRHKEPIILKSKANLKTKNRINKSIYCIFGLTIIEEINIDAYANHRTYKITQRPNIIQMSYSYTI